MVRSLAATGRMVAWTAADAFDRLRASARGPNGRGGAGDRDVGTGVVVRDGRVAFTADAVVDGSLVLTAAAVAAEHGIPFDRATLDRCGAITGIHWDDHDRERFVQLLAAGRRGVPVLEALDQVGALVALLPEWEHVRHLPQRNAYHRFTVDRHLLEAVAECAAIRDEEGFDGVVARETRPDLLLLGALLHDIGKGRPGDHSEVGAATAAEVARRVGLDDDDVDTVVWLVQHHLLLADAATRRDLSDEHTITRFGDAVGRHDRLGLLYVLTIGDSRATGPAAWGPSKAQLVRELFSKTDDYLREGVVGRVVEDERRAALGAHADLLARRELSVAWSTTDDGLLQCTVAAPDRTGLLAAVAGVLTLFGFDVRQAAGYSDAGGMALEVFSGVDAFDRLDDADGRSELEDMLAGALRGDVPVAARLSERIRRYRTKPGDVAVRFDLDASLDATVVEVHATDEVGLLARLAATFADLELDVRTAKVATLGDRVVDVFYLRSAQGRKITDRLVLERLKATLVARLTTDYVLP
jgi:[protein-PII] uridylyltransferase